MLEGRVKLNEYCEVTGCHDIYVIGDASASLNEKGEPYPNGSNCLSTRTILCLQYRDENLWSAG